MVSEGWQRVRLGDLAELVTSGSRGWAGYYNDVGDRFIRITNLSRENIALDLSDLKHVKLPLSSSEGQRTRLKQGDILISITADLGLIGYIEEEPEISSYINQHIAVVRLEEKKVFSKFVAHLLLSPHYQEIIRCLNDAGTKAGLNLPSIKSLPIVKPSIFEQKQIVRILSAWDKTIETVEKLIENSKAQKKALIQQLLTGRRRLPGFSGDFMRFHFSDIARIDARTLNNKTPHDFEFRYISLSDVEPGCIAPDLGYHVFSDAPSRARRVIRAGDIIMATVRPNFRHLPKLG